MKPARDSVILRAARKRLGNHQNDWLCSAIEKVGVGTPEQKRSLKRWIKHMLGRHLFYGSWVRANHPEIYERMNANRGHFREGRYAWISWMIEQCELAEAREQKEAA
jgi:hypothetical protein